MTKLKLAALAIAAAGLATPALADSAPAPQPVHHRVIHRSAAVTTAPAMGYAAEPMVNYNHDTPAAAGGGTLGYNQALDIDAN